MKLHLLFYLFSRLFVNWRLRHGIEPQFSAFLKGFNEIVPQHLLKVFDERELEVFVLNTFLYLVNSNQKKRSIF